MLHFFLSFLHSTKLFGHLSSPNTSHFQIKKPLEDYLSNQKPKKNISPWYLIWGFRTSIEEAQIRLSFAQLRPKQIDAHPQVCPPGGHFSIRCKCCAKVEIWRNDWKSTEEIPEADASRLKSPSPRLFLLSDFIGVFLEILKNWFCF